MNCAELRAEGRIAGERSRARAEGASLLAGALLLRPPAARPPPLPFGAHVSLYSPRHYGYRTVRELSSRRQLPELEAQQLLTKSALSVPSEANMNHDANREEWKLEQLEKLNLMGCDHVSSTRCASAKRLVERLLTCKLALVKRIART